MTNINHHNAKHGMSDHRLHIIWSKMKARCKRPHGKDAKYYFDKGVVVCDEWQNDFMAFANWALSHGYSSDLVLDRKKGTEGYTPKNCQWVSTAQNNRNKCSTKLTKEKVLKLRDEYSCGGITQRVLANKYGISTSHICSVLKGRYWNKQTL